MAKKRELPKHCYVKQGTDKIYIRYKNEAGKWVDRSSGFTLAQVDLLKPMVDAIVRRVEASVASNDPDVMTVRRYIERWAKEREERGVRSAKPDKKKLLKYAGSVLDMPIETVRTLHVRDLVRDLKKLVLAGTIAPRTALHIYAALHNVFENALVDELIQVNPVRVKDGELPKKVDADREWRSQATYLTSEVEQLISDARIPPERRVQYAMKAIAGLRHGEVAAMCWRHYDVIAEPLARLNVVQAWDSIEREIKETKTGHTREVPVHPTLAKILLAWRSLWPTIYGRDPGPDDFVVPARTGRCVAAGDAVKAMKADFDMLGLRKEAGKKRHRGGHDLRSWYQTQVIEDGADGFIARRTTHAADKSVNGGYERFSWSTRCREVAKLQINVVGEPLELAAGLLQLAKRSSLRWKSVTPKGLESISEGSSSNRLSSKDADLADPDRASSKVTAATAANDDALRAAEVALSRMDPTLALAIIKRMRARVRGAGHRHAPRDIVPPVTDSRPTVPLDR